jgi:hypothetical protein
VQSCIKLIVAERNRLPPSSWYNGLWYSLFRASLFGDTPRHEEWIEEIRASCLPWCVSLLTPSLFDCDCHTPSTVRAAGTAVPLVTGASCTILWSEGHASCVIGVEQLGSKKLVSILVLCRRRRELLLWTLSISIIFIILRISPMLQSTYVPKKMAQRVVRLQHLWRYVVSCIANLTEWNVSIFNRITDLASLVPITWLIFKPRDLAAMAKIQGHCDYYAC